jgi:hypothetical protein
MLISLLDKPRLNRGTDTVIYDFKGGTRLATLFGRINREISPYEAKQIHVGNPPTPADTPPPVFCAIVFVDI